MLVVILRVPVLPRVAAWAVVLLLATLPAHRWLLPFPLWLAQQVAADLVPAVMTQALDLVAVAAAWVCLDRAVPAQPQQVPTMAEVAKAVVPIPTGISQVDATARMLFAVLLVTVAYMVAVAVLVK
jgi:hypothetical protein